jgi:hypothetical protein
MINIPITKVCWAQNVDAGGEFAKSLTVKPGVKLYYLGHGVLVEQDGKPDKLVPISNVLTVEAGEKIAPDWWAAGSPPPSVVEYTRISGPQQSTGGNTITVPEDDDLARGTQQPKKRGPGRPPKGQA